jgi:hypothetical protein
VGVVTEGAAASDGATELAVLAALEAEAGTVPEEVARATAAAPVPVPRMTARPAAVLVRRERRGLRARATLLAESGSGGGGVKGYSFASRSSLILIFSLLPKGRLRAAFTKLQRRYWSIGQPHEEKMSFF